MKVTYKCPELPPYEGLACADLQPINDEFFKEVVRRQEDIINQILRQILNREPETEDYKQCTKVHKPQDEPNDYHFMYKDIPLGKVSFMFLGPKVTITFTPYAGNI
jgi:hypothetical protein